MRPSRAGGLELKQHTLQNCTAHISRKFSSVAAVPHTTTHLARGECILQSECVVVCDRAAPYWMFKGMCKMLGFVVVRHKGWRVNVTASQDGEKGGVRMASSKRCLGPPNSITHTWCWIYIIYTCNMIGYIIGHQRWDGIHC